MLKLTTSEGNAILVNIDWIIYIDHFYKWNTKDDYVQSTIVFSNGDKVNVREDPDDIWKLI